MLCRIPIRLNFVIDSSIDSSSSAYPARLQRDGQPYQKMAGPLAWAAGSRCGRLGLTLTKFWTLGDPGRKSCFRQIPHESPLSFLPASLRVAFQSLERRREIQYCEFSFSADGSTSRILVYQENEP